MRFKIDWTRLIVGRKLTFFALFHFVFESNYQVQAPGGLYLEGRFNGGFFALRVWGAYIWRGLYTAGLIFGILRYLQNWLIANRFTLNMLIKDLIRFMHSLSRKRQNRESKRKALIVPHSSPVGVDTYGPRSRGILPRLHFRCGFSNRSV